MDKPALTVGSTTLLDRVLAAAADLADQLVVVGPQRPTLRPVQWVREDPPGGGPVAALAAGLAVVGAPAVLLLAADLPFLDAGTLRALLGAADGHDGALVVDGDGREQWLCGAWSTAALRAGLAGLDPHGARLRAVLGGLDAVRVRPPVAAGAPAPWTDCDTPEDLAAARSRP